MRSILSLLLTLSIILFGPVAWADTTISQVTNNPYEDSFPRIGGNYLVWQGYVGGDWEIFLYNIETGETSQITDNSYDDLSPRTDGNYIVWQGFNDGEWDIFLWDGIEIQAISDRSAEDASPQIANGLIVWTSEPFGDDFVGPEEVMLYDAVTQTLTVLSAEVDPGNTLDDSGPKINDEVVIWVQTDDQENMTLYMYDLGNVTITENPEYVWRDSPQRDGNLSILTRHDGHDREILVYNSNSRTYHQITDNSLQDRYPSIGGNYVVSTGDEGEASGIYATITGNFIVWMGGQGEGSEIYLTFYQEEAAGTDTNSGGSGCFIDTAAFGGPSRTSNKRFQR